jgi:Protein of unknown function (DUF3616)
MPIQLKTSSVLHFNAKVLAKKEKDLPKARDNVSAIVLRGDHLWLGGDEGTSIDRMTRNAVGDFDSHTRFDLHGILKLPAAPKEEIDIEGLDVDGGYLWLIGSHSAKRKKPEPDKSLTENVDRLGTVEMEGNRFTLARVPVNASAEPVATHESLTAARLEGDAAENVLTKALKTDRHLGRFIPRASSDGSVEGIPSKDNGFDIEGLAVAGNRVFVGLRGPVLRGWAVVLELRVKATSDDVLTLEPIGPAGEPYAKHFLKLDGLGVRELVIHEKDLLVLAGPSMDLDGPVFIYRWKNALEAKADSMTSGGDLSQAVTVPFAKGRDHAEGLTAVTRAPLTVLVSYDSPGEGHLDKLDESVVKADIFEVPV